MELVLQLAALLLFLAAAFGYANSRFLRLPPTVGMVVIALAASLAVLAIDAALPGWGLRSGVRGLLEQIDFHETLMKGLLSFLLFAGALHVDLADLARRKWAISVMATAGVLISTGLVAGAMWLAFAALGIALPFAYALVLGAILAPTDPVAVLGILKTVKVPKSLEADIAGESLFNDGVGVVLFTILVAIAVGGPGAEMGPAAVVGLFLLEAVGGAALGLALGFLAFLAMRGIDDYAVEVLITLALVTVTYGLADALHLSGPIAVVVAGILVGNRGTRLAMSEKTREHLLNFWELIDEILNAVLFLLIGFEVLAVSLTMTHFALAAIAIPVVLASRLVSVSVPFALPFIRGEGRRGEVQILTWGGLKGGISVALALSLPASPLKGDLLAACYGVVVFSIVVQGLSMARLVRHYYPPAEDGSA